MVYINMSILKIIFVVVMAFISFIHAVPTSLLHLEHRTIDEDLPLSSENIDTTMRPSTSAPEQDTYDQRQNGTENFRIQVKGLVVLLAPMETLLLASGGLGGANELLGGLNDFTVSPVEKPKPKPDDMKPISSHEDSSDEDLKARIPAIKSVHRPHLKIISMLAPFLKRDTLHGTSF